MTKTNKIIGTIMGAALAVTVFAGTLPYAAAAENPKNVSQTYCGNGFGSGMAMQMGRGFGNMVNTIANFLGIDSSKVIASRQEGKSMVQIAQENGKSENELYNYITGQRKAQLDQLVASGRITAEVAAAQETIMKERIKENLNRTDVGPGFNKAGQNKKMVSGKYQRNCPGYGVNNQ